LLIDLVVKALAPVLPDKVAAAHFGDSMVLFLAGKDPRRNDQGFLHVMPHAGGWGGFEGGDGQDGLINNVNGGFKDFPVEIFEVRFPAKIRRYEFRPDTGGVGRFRGGCGLLRRFEVDPDSFLYLWLERSVTPAWGLFEGGEAVGPDVIINPGRGDERRMLKVNAHPLAAGSVVELLTGGGGGFGRADERDPERVRADVLDGYVSREAAAEAYGVVLDERLAVDLDATRRLRAPRPAAGGVG
jgi:N-methylhydantoinase B